MKPKNELLRRVQRYAQASTIFRTRESSAEVASPVQRSAVTPTKATFLSQPSTLPLGRTVAAQDSGSIPVTATFPAELATADATTPTASGDSLAAAIDQVTQLQRSPERTGVNRQQATPEISSPLAEPTFAPSSVGQPTPVASQNAVQAAPAIEPDTSASDWTRLQRIIKGHETKQTASQPETAPPQTIQRAETEETAVSPIPSPSAPNAIQRAAHRVESPAQKAPLESVWPVVQVEKTASTHDEPVVMQQPDTPISTEPTQSPAEAETIRRKLGDVVSTKRTDSSIELHLPRRPRPAPIQAKTAPTDPNQAFWERMRKAEGKPPETVQRTVETEIGPLPADMWELLGEEPPSPPSTAENHVTETALSSGGDAPPVQMKAIEEAAPQTDEGQEETAVPSFLAKTTTETAVNASDTATNTESVQRAIAAAETQASAETAETTPPTVQRKEAAAATTTSPTTPQKESVSSEPQLPTATQPRSESPEQTIGPLATRSTREPAAATIQREVESTDSPASEPIQSAAESGEGASNATTTEVAASTEISTASETPSTPIAIPPSASTSDLQRAIAAAESPPPASAETPQSAPITATPVETRDPAVEKPIQPKRLEATPETPSKPMKQTVLPEPVSEDGAPSSKEQIADKLSALPVQRSVDSPGAAPQTAVDLNAETAPLPELPERDVLETAVSPPRSSLDSSFDTPTAIQRAIAAAEAPTRQPGISHSVAAQTHPASTDSATNVAIQRTPSSPPAPELIQGQPNTVETISTTSEQLLVKTAVAPSTTPPSNADTVQRAIAAAETAPTTSEPPLTQTAVATPPSISDADTVQRAIAAVETTPAPPTPSTPQTAVVPHPTASTPDTSQRSIANTETSPLTPQSRQPAEATPLRRETQIQRAISAAEAPPASSSQPSTAPSDIQRSTTGMETAVIPASTLAQNSMANGRQITQEPEIITPLTATTATPSLMRAVAAAESPPPKPTPATGQEEAMQWPDILSTSPAETTADIQQNETEASTPNIQRKSPEPQEDSLIGDEENEEDDENDAEAINVDQLANEVYSQLKKRLAIEWERGRGKR